MLVALTLFLTFLLSFPYVGKHDTPGPAAMSQDSDPATDHITADVLEQLLDFSKFASELSSVAGVQISVDALKTAAAANVKKDAHLGVRVVTTSSSTVAVSQLTGGDEDMTAGGNTEVGTDAPQVNNELDGEDIPPVNNRIEELRERRRSANGFASMLAAVKISDALQRSEGNKQTPAASVHGADDGSPSSVDSPNILEAERLRNMNPYLYGRLGKVKRNNERLLELGQITKAHAKREYADAKRLLLQSAGEQDPADPTGSPTIPTESLGMADKASSDEEYEIDEDDHDSSSTDTLEESTATPVPPRATKRKVPQLVVPEVAKKVEEVCNHESSTQFEEETNGNYFRADYLLDNEWAVRSCATCNKLFGTEYKVSSKQSVFVCRNAKKQCHKCVHAFCAPCFVTLLDSSADGSRSRSSRRRLN
jgi:hypothetical protein